MVWVRQGRVTYTCTTLRLYLSVSLMMRYATQFDTLDISTTLSERDLLTRNPTLRWKVWSPSRKYSRWPDPKVILSLSSNVPPNIPKFHLKSCPSPGCWFYLRLDLDSYTDISRSPDPRFLVGRMHPGQMRLAFRAKWCWFTPLHPLNSVK